MCVNTQGLGLGDTTITEECVECEKGYRRESSYPGSGCVLEQTCTITANCKDCNTDGYCYKCDLGYYRDHEAQ